jgi:mycothiol synthase
MAATPDSSSATPPDEDRGWENTRLLMRRPWLGDLPPIPAVPDGMVARRYVPADRPRLLSLLSTAFEERWTEDQLESRLTGAPDVPVIYIIAQGDAIVATASVRLMPERYPDAGYVHWVAVDPAHQGHGLGITVTLMVLEHFVSLGLSTAVLETHSFRFAAQRTYLRLGFVPEYDEPAGQLRWARLLPRHLERAR